jgi:hypothetical protein
MPDEPRPQTSAQSPGLIPPMSPWAKFVLYLLAQTANGCLMFEAFAQGSAAAKVCSIAIFVLGTITQVVPRKNA